MKFEEALKAMKAGSKAKLPSWGGYWYWSPEKETIIMHTKDGQELCCCDFLGFRRDQE